MASCRTCKFMRKNGATLECHRQPPPWHPVAAHDWCGQWVMMDLPVIGPARHDREETDDSTSVWYGLRPAVRARLSRAVQHLRERGSLRRSDIEYLGEVSTPQASNDIAEIQKRLPDLMRYDPSAKCYVLTDSNQGNTDEPDEQQQDSVPG